MYSDVEINEMLQAANQDLDTGREISALIKLNKLASFLEKYPKETDHYYRCLVQLNLLQAIIDAGQLYFDRQTAPTGDQAILSEEDLLGNTRVANYLKRAEENLSSIKNITDEEKIAFIQDLLTVATQFERREEIAEQQLTKLYAEQPATIREKQLSKQSIIAQEIMALSELNRQEKTAGRLKKIINSAWKTAQHYYFKTIEDANLLILNNNAINKDPRHPIIFKANQALINLNHRVINKKLALIDKLKEDMVALDKTYATLLENNKATGKPKNFFRDFRERKIITAIDKKLKNDKMSLLDRKENNPNNPYLPHATHSLFESMKNLAKKKEARNSAALEKLQNERIPLSVLGFRPNL